MFRQIAFAAIAFSLLSIASTNVAQATTNPCIWGPGNYAMISVWVAPAATMSDLKKTYVPLTLRDYLNGTGSALENAYINQLQSEGYRVYPTTVRLAACF